MSEVQTHAGTPASVVPTSAIAVGPAAGTPPRFPRAGICTLLVATAILGLIGIDWGLPAFESWSNDDITPGQVVRIAHYRFRAVTKYPPFAYVIPALAYAPYLEFLKLTGGLRNPTVNFPHGFEDPLTALTVLIILGRLLSVLMAVGAVYFVYQGTRALLNDHRAALLASCLVAFHAEFNLFATLGNVDMQGIFWLAAAFACYARLLAEPRASTARLLGITTVLASGTKDYLLFAAVGMALVLAAVWIRERRSSRPLVWGVGAFVTTYVLANNWVLGWPQYVTRLRWLSTVANQESIQYPATLAGHVLLLTRALELLANDTGWPMAAAMIAGGVIAGLSRPRIALALLVPVMTFYVGAIAPLRFVFPRYILPWALFLGPFAGLALSRLLDDGLPARSLRRFAVVGVLAWSLLLAMRTDLDFVFDSRYEAERYLRAHVSPSARVEVYGPFVYLPRLREMGFTVHTISGEDALAPPSPLDGLRARAPDVIVLSSKYMAEGKSPMRKYLRSLVTEPLGYRVTTFGRESHRWGMNTSTAGGRYVSRANPTIWVLEREGGATSYPTSTTVQGQ